MHDLLPDGEDLRSAVKWVSGHLLENPGQPVPPLVREAIFKFDLSPLDAEFLIGFYGRTKENPSPFIAGALIYFLPDYKNPAEISAGSL